MDWPYGRYGSSILHSVIPALGHDLLVTWVKVFRIIPEFRILRLTFHKYADSYGFFDLISVYLKTIDHLNLKLLIFVGILHV